VNIRPGLKYEGDLSVFCPKCGVEAGATKYCRSCGTNLTVVSNVLEGGPSRSRTTAFGSRTRLNLFQSTRLSNEIDMDGQTAVSICGETRIDLTAIPLLPGETRINVISLFGATEVFVPDDVAVRVTGVSIFGGVKIRGRALSNSIFSTSSYETPGFRQAAVRLHIDATTIFSGLKIKR
jgi:predicted membrane protein